MTQAMFVVFGVSPPLIRLTDEILLDALFTGLGENRDQSHVEQAGQHRDPPLQ